MDSVSVADAKAQLDKIIDHVEAGGAVDITRRGKPVARLTAVRPHRKRIDAAALRALTAAMPLQTQGAADLVRAMRDHERS